MDIILAIDQSTSGTKAACLDGQMRIHHRETLAHRQFYPAPGYVEHDAEEIFHNTVTVLQRVLEKTPGCHVAALGIANQRETVVLWRRDSGKPVCPAIVWQDVRSKPITDELAPHAETIRTLSGLHLSPYFTAAKIASALRASPDIAAEAKSGNLCAGTVDSYLLYRLTGGKAFATDISNASRMQLMNLQTLQWDAQLCGLFGIPMSILPERIEASDACYGHTACEGLPCGIPIHAMMGDSHASFFGHGCHTPGTVKTSYGTGSSIMMNIGAVPKVSTHGLSTSVGFGFNGKVCYVLEGNITSSADTLIWLRDEIGLIQEIADIEPLAASVPDTQGVCLVPAFSGLGTPYYDEKARAILCGMSRGTTRAHILRAALASIVHQNADVLDAMQQDAGSPVTHLKADGGASVNKLLMQMQSDYVPCQVDRVSEKDLSLLGIGLMAGLSAGLYSQSQPLNPAESYHPQLDETARKSERACWADAIRRAR